MPPPRPASPIMTASAPTPPTSSTSSLVRSTFSFAGLLPRAPPPSVAAGTELPADPPRRHRVIKAVRHADKLDAVLKCREPAAGIVSTHADQVDEIAREASIIKELSATTPPVAPPLLAAGTDRLFGSPRSFLITQLVGTPLAQCAPDTIRRHAARIATALLRALQTAHSLGHVHGALHPDSILLAPPAAVLLVGWDQPWTTSETDAHHVRSWSLKAHRRPFGSPMTAADDVEAALLSLADVLHPLPWSSGASTDEMARLKSTTPLREVVPNGPAWLLRNLRRARALVEGETPEYDAMVAEMVPPTAPSEHDAVVAELRARVAELERQLAASQRNDEAHHHRKQRSPSHGGGSGRNRSGSRTRRDHHSARGGGGGKSRNNHHHGHREVPVQGDPSALRAWQAMESAPPRHTRAATAPAGPSATGSAVSAGASAGAKQDGAAWLAQATAGWAKATENIDWAAVDDDEEEDL
ncbi:hypothetical protein AMAG_17371 [Allomyces macrogynus ATCC 38327]|uniref:Protein kinase domain-containing protein n=1 Tax=Allomyces macrogynus (strain ATCC 38327) TaxID=578462 RepID=A0A0L0TF16_ALLM3|nr:hypothetical protein AMAG_17371 [Allomyces macrogynus ATCC 38327]|eukprot:KNE73179.1 hypothetical protein AMAG_17371 [Allomyces macrogynus ATCC 38327]